MVAQCLYRALNVVCLETLTSLDVTARREVKQYGFNSGGKAAIQIVKCSIVQISPNIFAHL